MQVNEILIIGANSQAALALSKQIEKKGNFRITGLTSKKTPKNGNINLINYEKLHELKGRSYKKIIIMASKLPHETTNLNEFLKVNLKIEDALKSISYGHNERTHITFLSSFSLYEKHHQTISQETPINISEPYAYAKFKMESFLEAFCSERNISCISARIPVLLYKGGTTNFINRIGNLAKTNGVATLYNPDSFFSAVFSVDNLSELAFAETMDSPYTMVNCCSAPDITFSEIADIAMKYGLREVNWLKSEELSPLVSPMSLQAIGVQIPSARQLIEKWFEDEFGASYI